MIEKTINTKNIEDAEVVIVSAPYDKTTSSRKGAKNGPGAIIKCLDYKLEFFDRDILAKTNDLLKVSLKKIKFINHLSPLRSKQKIENICMELLNQNKFIFLLGGEHSVSYGYLEALSKKHNPNDVTILQIDAHCDLRDNDGDYDTSKVSNLAHSCVMRRVSELGYNIVQVGIRTYSKDEYNYFTNNTQKIKVFEWGKENVPTIDEIINSVKTDKVYITIDVDGFDPSFMPGTGTPVQGGLDWWYGMNLIKKLINQKELIGADIVEVAPMKDSVLTEYGAAQLFYTILSHKFKNKLS